jgi:hypothetical protein
MAFAFSSSGNSTLPSGGDAMLCYAVFTQVDAIQLLAQ